MKYEVKLTMKGKIPSGIEIFKFEIDEIIFDRILGAMIKADLKGKARRIP